MVYEEPKMSVFVFDWDEIITSSSLGTDFIGPDDNLDLDAEENQP